MTLEAMKYLSFLQLMAFPPVAADKYYVGKEEIENSDQFIRTKDHRRCDFQRPDGNIYIVQRRIGP